jgi:hypothetical protein
VLFIEKGFGILKSEGTLGYILPSKFTSAKYGVGTRQLLTENSCCKRLVDF